MTAIENNTIAIDFSDKVLKEPELFEYCQNDLYNLSVPLLSIALTLARLPKPENLALFKGLLKQHIVELSERGKALDYPSAVIDKLCCLHCIVLDEFIIHGRWGENAGWENNTLLSELFGLKNGGDVFFTIADKALVQSAKMADLLAVIYVLLQMGFKGRYRSREAEQLGIITKNISQTIKHQITEADILLKDSPKIKALFLTSGARYVSFTLLILVSVTIVSAFFDYWFKETYALRSREFTELKTVTASYILNAKTRDIVYTSTAEDIHSVKNLSHRGLTSIILPAVPAAPTELTMSEQTLASASFLVQLASFSSEKNAQNYLKNFKGSRYPLAIKTLGNYFIIFSSALSEQQAKQQVSYFNENFQVSAIVSKLNVTGTKP